MPSPAIDNFGATPEGTRMRSGTLHRPDWRAVMTLVRLAAGGGILGAAIFDLAARLAGFHHPDAFGIDALGALVGITAATVALVKFRPVE